MDSLPPVLRRYVHEDNRWFQQELSEWEEQFCQAAAPQGESTSSSAEPLNPCPEEVQQNTVKTATEKLDQVTETQPDEEVIQKNAEAEKPEGMKETSDITDI